jgi:hypothetical protein
MSKANPQFGRPTPEQTRALNAAFAIAYPLSHGGHAFNLDTPIQHHEWDVTFLFHEFMLNPPDPEDVQRRCREAAARVRDKLDDIHALGEEERVYQLSGRRANPRKSGGKAANTAALLADLGDLKL